jgi:putative zinc finger/helix-turn-helix YgiT family protein
MSEEYFAESMQAISEHRFPWKCGACGERAIVRKVTHYTVQYGHDGRTYTVNVPDLEVPTCENCGEMAFDSRATLRIDQAFRDQIGLLAPEQIRHNREALGLTQEQLATNLGIASATISRWESGHQIQQRAMDRLLRLHFAYPGV